MQILTEPKNALIRQYQRLFEFENVRLRFADDALETVADLALQRKVGARGLRMILEDLMLELMYHLPAQRKLREFVVTAEMVRNREINWTLLGKEARGKESAKEPSYIHGNHVHPRKKRLETRADDAGARPGHFPADDESLHRRPGKFACAPSKKRWPATRKSSSPPSTTPRWMIPSPMKSTRLALSLTSCRACACRTEICACWSKASSAPKSCRVTTDEGFFRATLKVIANKVEPSPQVEQAVTKVTGLFEQYVKLSQSLNYDTMIAATRVDDAAKLSDTIASNLQIPVEEKQELLENFDPLDRLNRVGEILESEIEKLNVDRNINTRVKRQMERAQKEYYLNEKLKAIHKELGRGEKNELEELKKKIDTAGMPKDTHEKAVQELKRLEMMPPMSAESTVSRNYLEWLLAVPWKKKSKEIRDIELAEKILEEDHYGLEKVKERILEYLAVRQLVKNPRGSILCFVGPPGVGKTSLAMSIGRATGRKFVRVSLGGVRDEAEIRGHRRTYIGALPGQIIQMMKKAGTVNPIFVLDEVDKMSTDFRGDPSAALMEVLDPELNHAFTDHYLDVEYDLSKVMFVCTANVMHTIPQPLQDRMEILRIPGYTEVEKTQIAKRFLVRKALEAAGLTEANLTFSDEAVTHIIRHYTHEAGVRSLEREISNICRKVARRVVKEGKQYSIAVTPENVGDFLGVIKFREIWAEKKNEIGLATGLAWTEVGGSVLSTEATIMQGKGRLTLTGKLGDVMQESAQAAMSYVRSRTATFGLPRDFYRHIDIHCARPRGRHSKGWPLGRNYHRDYHRQRA